MLFQDHFWPWARKIKRYLMVSDVWSPSPVWSASQAGGAPKGRFRLANQTNRPTNKQETPSSKRIGMKDAAEVIHREDQGNQRIQTPRIISFDDPPVQINNF